MLVTALEVSSLRIEQSSEFEFGSANPDGISVGIGCACLVVSGAGA